MILNYFTADNIFNLNNIILIGWITLIFAPFRKISKYLILAPALFLSVLYSLILFRTLFFRDANSPPLDFFHLSGWKALLKDPYMIIGTTNHFCVMDLWVGRWMVYDFYSGYTFAYKVKSDSNGTYKVNKSWTFGRILFTVILLLTYMVAPFGFLIYNLAKFTFLKKYRANVRINIENGKGYVENSHVNQLQSYPFSRRPLRFGDKLPEPFHTIYYFLIGIVGLLVLLIIVLPAYIALRIYSRIIYKFPPPSLDQSTASSSPVKPDKKVPEYVRNITANMRLVLLSTPTDKRNWICYLKFVLLQFATFIEYIVNSSQPVQLFKALEDYFYKLYHVPYFVFGDGIAVNSYELVKRYLQDIPPRKGFESLGWKVSSSQATFCDFTTIFLSSDDPDMKLGRNIVFKWLHAFPHNLRNEDFERQLHLSRIVPRKTDEKPTEKLVYQSIGEVMFYLATGGELRQNERSAFVDCVKTPFIFFPNWFNFLLNGYFFERRTLNSYYTLLQAFSRYADGPALGAAFAAADNKKSKEEVLKLIAIVFSIAGSAAPAKLAVTVIHKLWEDKEKYVPLFEKNPHNFIKECARLDKVVPMVNVLATNDIANEIEESFRNKNENVKIHENTPIHCSIVNANRDEKIFQDPNNFQPDRPELNKLIVWNGVEEDILNKDASKRPIRYCPGHDLSIDVIQYVAQRYLPVIIGNTNNYQQDKTITEQTDLSSNDQKQNNDNQSQQEKNFSNENLNKESSSSTKYTNEKEMGLINAKIRKLQRTEAKRCCKQLDMYTILVMQLMKKAVKESNLSPARAIDMSPPLNLPAEDLGIYRIDMAKFIPTWDEDEPNGSSIDRRFFRWLVNSRIWDFYDCLAEFDTIDQALAWRSKLFSALPLPNVVYTDMSSDKAMTQLAFSGCACHYTQRVGDKYISGIGIPERKFLKTAVYVNDMTGLSIFRVRKPFERYGAAAYFDKNFNIIAIYWSHASRLVKLGDQFWEHVKYVWRSSFFAYVTICDHLIVTHMIECNAFVSASRKHLPIDHPLRLFIKPFTYHTVAVNHQAAVSLVNRRGLVHRIWAFDYDEFLKVCDYISINYKFKCLPDFIDESMHPDKNIKHEDKKKNEDEWDKIYPIHKDLHAFWEIIQNYVKKFFKINYKSLIKDEKNDSTIEDKKTESSRENDNEDKLPIDSHITNFIDEICKQLGIPGITSLQRFIDVLSQLIAASTGIHEHVGQISDYMIDPRFIGAKLQEGKEIQNIQTYTQILILAVITGLRMPGILEDWSHLIEHDEFYLENLNNYKDFKKQLQNLSSKIDMRNKERNYPFQSFNPKFIECSTSV